MGKSKVNQGSCSKINSVVAAAPNMIQDITSKKPHTVPIFCVETSSWKIVEELRKIGNVFLVFNVVSTSIFFVVWLLPFASVTC